MRIRTRWDALLESPEWTRDGFRPAQGIMLVRVLRERGIAWPTFEVGAPRELAIEAGIFEIERALAALRRAAQNLDAEAANRQAAEAAKRKEVEAAAQKPRLQSVEVVEAPPEEISPKETPSEVEESHRIGESDSRRAVRIAPPQEPEGDRQADELPPRERPPVPAFLRRDSQRRSVVAAASASPQSTRVEPSDEIPLASTQYEPGTDRPSATVARALQGMPEPGDEGDLLPLASTMYEPGSEPPTATLVRALQGAPDEEAENLPLAATIFEPGLEPPSPTVVRALLGEPDPPPAGELPLAATLIDSSTATYLRPAATKPPTSILPPRRKSDETDALLATTMAENVTLPPAPTTSVFQTATILEAGALPGAFEDKPQSAVFRPTRGGETLVNITPPAKAETPEDVLGVEMTISDFCRAKGLDEGVTLARRADMQKTLESIARDQVKHRRYSVVREIATGGMGKVLEAEDRDLHRRVALKILRAELLDRTDLVARFLEEAQVTGQLEHPNIVSVHEVGVDGGGNLYFTMRMVEGQDLSEILKRLRDGSAIAAAQWPLPRLLDVLLKVCEGVSYAHSRGVLHRDLKPANIMVGRFGEVQIMDWGIARIFGRAEKEGGPAILSDRRESDTELTMTGSKLGTPAYMSPEQADGETDTLGPQSDVFSLGCILYEILCHHLPWKVRNLKELLAEVKKGASTPPSAHAPKGKVPAELDALAMKCLAADKRDRIKSVPDLIENIRAYQDGRTLAAVNYTLLQLIGKWVARHKGRVIAASLVLLALVGGGFGAAEWMRQRELAEVPGLVSRADEAIKESEEDLAQNRFEDAIEHSTSAQDLFERILALDSENAEALAGFDAAIAMHGRIKAAEARYQAQAEQRQEDERERLRLQEHVDEARKLLDDARLHLEKVDTARSFDDAAVALAEAMRLADGARVLLEGIDSGADLLKTARLTRTRALLALAGRALEERQYDFCEYLLHTARAEGLEAREIEDLDTRLEERLSAQAAYDTAFRKSQDAFSGALELHSVEAWRSAIEHIEHAGKAARGNAHAGSGDLEHLSHWLQLAYIETLRLETETHATAEDLEGAIEEIRSLMTTTIVDRVHQSQAQELLDDLSLRLARTLLDQAESEGEGDAGRVRELLEQVLHHLPPDEESDLRERIEAQFARLEADAPGSNVALLPRGLFVAGSSHPEDHNPMHVITHQSLLLMDRTPVTNAEFQQFVKAGGYGNDQWWDKAALALRAGFVDATGKPGPAGWRNGTPAQGQGDFPVTGVSWYEARAYARWAKKRLPSADEWEIAAGAPRAGETAASEYPFGDAESALAKGAGKAIREVATADWDTNPLGIRDLGCNVTEWTADPGLGEQIVCRGAEPGLAKNVFLQYARRTKYRFANPADRSSTRGFRCVREFRLDDGD